LLTAARVLVLALVLILALTHQVLAETGSVTDLEFIESLGDESSGAPVDRKRLARIFFSLAATLEGGKSSVQLLQGSVVVPETSRRAVYSLLRTRFESYSRALTRFKGSVTDLLDEPYSLLRLQRMLVDGQRACWQFDLHNRLIETYGADASMLSILSSREACSRLQLASFQPRVRAIIVDALVERVYQHEEIRDLQADLRDLEELLADLQEIDEAD
jgi:hypothetical protein